MIRIELNWEESKKIGRWSTGDDINDRLAKVQEHLENYGFLFDEFRLVLDDQMQFIVEIDKDVFSIRRVVFKKNIKENYVFSHREYFNAFKKSEEDLENYVKTDYAKCCLLMAFIEYVIYNSMNQEVILVEETERRYTNKSSSKKATTKNVYSLTDCVRKYAKHVNHCKHVYTCEHWEVKGHFRHYKSGKVVFVRPFEKGKNRDVQTKKKVYTL